MIFGNMLFFLKTSKLKELSLSDNFGGAGVTSAWAQSKLSENQNYLPQGHNFLKPFAGQKLAAKQALKTGNDFFINFLDKFTGLLQEV